MKKLLFGSSSTTFQSEVVCVCVNMLEKVLAFEVGGIFHFHRIQNLIYYSMYYKGKYIG